MKTLITTITLCVLGLAFWAGALSVKKAQVVGSVDVGNQYQSTSTPALADLTNICPQKRYAASSTTGLLGSVNILSTGSGSFTAYDATTTDVNLRSADQATTSIRLADFQTAVVTGSYHFDVEFKRGLLIDYTSAGTGIASTTISYRCEG